MDIRLFKFFYRKLGVLTGQDGATGVGNGGNGSGASGRQHMRSHMRSHRFCSDEVLELVIPFAFISSHHASSMHFWTHCPPLS